MNIIPYFFGTFLAGVFVLLAATSPPLRADSHNTAALIERLNAANARIEDLLAENSGLRGQLQDAREALTQSDRQREKLVNEIGVLESSMTGNEEALVQVSEQLQTVERELEIVTRRLEVCSEGKASVEAQLASCQAGRIPPPDPATFCIGEVSTARDALSACEEARSTMVSGNLLTDVQSELDSCREDGANLRDELALVSNQLNMCNSQRTRAISQEDFDRVNDDLEACFASSDLVTDRNVGLLSDLDSCFAEADVLRDELDQAVDEASLLIDALNICEASTSSHSCEDRIPRLLTVVGSCGEPFGLSVDQDVLEVSGIARNERELSGLVSQLEIAYYDLMIDTSGVSVSPLCREPIGVGEVTVDTLNGDPLLTVKFDILDRPSLLSVDQCATMGADIDQASNADLVFPRSYFSAFWVLGEDGFPTLCRKEGNRWIHFPPAPTEATDKKLVIRIAPG